MNCPHPILAALARLTAAAAVAFLALYSSWLVVPSGDARWFGGELFDRLTSQPSARDLREFAQHRLFEVATSLVKGVGWLAVAGLLRRAAAGKLRLAGPGGGWVAGAGPVGLAAGLAGVLVAVAVWVAPVGERWVALRLKDAVDPPTVGWGEFLQSGSGSFVSVRSVPPVGVVRMNPPSWAELYGRLLDAARSEGFRLLTAVLPWSVLFCLSGVVYCLTRPDPEADS